MPVVTRRMKIKRVVDSNERPPKTSRLSTCPSTAPATEDPFRCVLSLLKAGVGKVAYRYPVSVEELMRRTAPPESMSINTMMSLLRTNKNEKGRLREELKKVGVSPGPVTQVTSLCSRLTEAEAKELCHSVGVLASKGIHHEAVTMPLPSDTSLAAGKATELKNQLQHLAKEVHRNGHVFANLSHGLGPGMVDVVVDILTDCIDANMAKLQ